MSRPVADETDPVTVIEFHILRKFHRQVDNIKIIKGIICRHGKQPFRVVSATNVLQSTSTKVDWDPQTIPYSVTCISVNLILQRSTLKATF